MKSCSLLLALGMLLFCSIHLHGQTAQGHIYEDSSILYPEADTNQVIEAPQEDAQETIPAADESVPEKYFTDTSMVNNQHFLSPDSIRHLKNTKQFAYAKVLDSLLKDYQKKSQAKRSETVEDSKPSWLELFFASKLTQYFFWGLAILFIGFIVVKLFFSGGFFERQTAKSNVKILEEEAHGPVKDKNYDRLIATAVKEQNYRLATRYLYLQLLQKLAKAGAIEFTADKTNTEYLRELTGKPYKDEVAGLTLHYEYVWYGEFAIDVAAYSRLEARFKNLNV